jgi:spore coat protein U-like protein
MKFFIRRMGRPGPGAALACGALALLFSGGAHALVSSCTVSASGVAFGVYDPTVATATFSSGTIGVSCVVSGATGHNPVTIAFDTGSSGTFISRTMLNGADPLAYNLYLDAAYTQVWGDGTGVSFTDTVFVTPGKPSFSATVYGMIPALQTPGSGTFTDTITVTVSF